MHPTKHVELKIRIWCAVAKGECGSVPRPPRTPCARETSLRQSWRCTHTLTRKLYQRGSASSAPTTSWTYGTEREISGNNGIESSVSGFCSGNHPPFQPILGAQQRTIREKRAGSCECGKLRFGLRSQYWRGMSASCRLSQLQSCRSWLCSACRWKYSARMAVTQRSNGR